MRNGNVVLRKTIYYVLKTLAVGLAITLASELCKYPQAGSLTDRATLYKHAYSKIPLKNSVIDTESMIYKAQVIEVCCDFRYIITLLFLFIC